MHFCCIRKGGNGHGSFISLNVLHIDLLWLRLRFANRRRKQKTEKIKNQTVTICVCFPPLISDSFYPLVSLKIARTCGPPESKSSANVRIRCGFGKLHDSLIFPLPQPQPRELNVKDEKLLLGRVQWEHKRQRFRMRVCDSTGCSAQCSARTASLRSTTKASRGRDVATRKGGGKILNPYVLTVVCGGWELEPKPGWVVRGRLNRTNVPRASSRLLGAAVARRRAQCAAAMHQIFKPN